MRNSFHRKSTPGSKSRTQQQTFAMPVPKASTKTCGMDMRCIRRPTQTTTPGNRCNRPPACASDSRVLIAVPELFIQRASFREVHFSSGKEQCQCGRARAAEHEPHGHGDSFRHEQSKQIKARAINLFRDTGNPCLRVPPCCLSKSCLSIARAHQCGASPSGAKLVAHRRNTASYPFEQRVTVVCVKV